MFVLTGRAVRVIVGLAVVAVGVALALIGARAASADASTGTTTVHVKQSTVNEYQGCSGMAGAYFVITQITDPPESVTVSLSDGSSGTAPLVKSPGKTAHYSYSFGSAVSVTDATAQVPDGWSGQFNISHCLPGSPPSSSTPPSSSGSSASSASGSGSSASSASGSGSSASSS